MGPFLAPTTSAALARLAELDRDATSAPIDRLQGIRALHAALDSDPATLASARAARDLGTGSRRRGPETGGSQVALAGHRRGDRGKNGGRSQALRPTEQRADRPAGALRCRGRGETPD